MQISEEDFRRRYAELNDDGLLAINRDELVEVARRCCDAELARRGLSGGPRNAGESRVELNEADVSATVIASAQAGRGQSRIPTVVTQARAALYASIMLVLARADWIAGQVVALNHMTDFRVVYAVQLFVNALFLVPLPVLLFLLYRQRTTLVLTTSMRILAAATALIVGLVFTAPPLYGIARAIGRDLSGINWFGATPVAPGIRTWLTSSSAKSEFRDCIVQFSQISLAIFLVALVRRKPNHSAGAEHDYRLLMRVAGVATIAAAIAVVLNIVGQVRAAQDFSARQGLNDWFGGPTRLHFVIQNAFFGCMEVCRFLVPMVVYQSLSASAPEEWRVHS